MGARHAVLGELRDPEVAGGAAGVAAAADDRCEAAQHAVPAADAPNAMVSANSVQSAAFTEKSSSTDLRIYSATAAAVVANMDA